MKNQPQPTAIVAAAQYQCDAVQSFIAFCAHHASYVDAALQPEFEQHLVRVSSASNHLRHLVGSARQPEAACQAA
jgi:hypothetical protein